MFDSDMQLQLGAVLVLTGVVLYIVVLELIVSLLVYCYKGDVQTVPISGCAPAVLVSI